MKKTRLWRLLLLSVWVLPMLGACSSDNDNYDGGSDAVKKRRITKIENENYDIAFTYDVQDRVVQAVMTIGQKSMYRYTYQYDETAISRYYEEEEHFPNGIIGYTNLKTSHYTLSDGLIVSEEEETGNGQKIYRYNYDSDGYLVSIEEDNGKSYSLTWTDGNLKQYMDNKLQIDAHELSYTDTPWPSGFIYPDIIILNIDNVLFSMGYFGKQPRTLLAQEPNTNFYYSYVYGDGTLIRVIEEYGQSGNKVLNYFWEFIDHRGGPCDPFACAQ